MKFSCPECQANYNANLPAMGDTGVEVKCARCLHVFMVQEEAAVGASTQMENSSSQTQESISSSPVKTSDRTATPAEVDNDLDAFLDDLIEQEITEKPDSSSTTDDSQTEAHLDGLLNDLLADTATPDPPPQVPPMDDQALDQVWEEAVEEGRKEEKNEATATPPPESATEEPATKPITESEPVAETQNTSDSTGDALEEEEDPWAAAFADQAATEAEQASDEKASAEPATEEAPAEEEDPWAAAFADQAATEAQQASGEETPAESGTEEAPAEEEDPWAAAFADQAATEAEQASDEKASAEPAAEEAPAEEEDPWAAAFADQAATEAEQASGEETPAESGTEETPAEEEDPWAAAFADQAATEAEQASDEKASAEPAAEEATGDAGESEEDLWAQAFADQDAVESEQQEKPAENASGDEDESEEKLWAQAFDESGDADSAQPAATDDASGEAGGTALGEEPSDEELAKLAAIAADDSGPGLADEAMANYNEDDYEEVDDDEFEAGTKKKKFGFLPMPSGKTGKLMVGGGVLALLLICGSVYFAMETFAPSELIEEGKMAQSQDAGSGESSEAEPAPEIDPKVPDNKKEATPSAVEQAQNALLNDTPAEETKPDEATVTEPAEPEVPATLDKALQPFADIVEMGTIMPVAYSSTDIKVLSFILRLEMDTPRTAEGMRDALPIYEKVMVVTIEDFLQRKFYNDVLYVKEKLVKRLELAINKSLKDGKIKKAKFKEFQIS